MNYPFEYGLYIDCENESLMGDAIEYLRENISNSVPWYINLTNEKIIKKKFNPYMKFSIGIYCKGYISPGIKSFNDFVGDELRNSFKVNV
jgi:hypothetical protein